MDCCGVKRAGVSSPAQPKTLTVRLRIGAGVARKTRETPDSSCIGCLTVQENPSSLPIEPEEAGGKPGNIRIECRSFREVCCLFAPEPRSRNLKWTRCRSDSISPISSVLHLRVPHARNEESSLPKLLTQEVSKFVGRVKWDIAPAFFLTMHSTIRHLRHERKRNTQNCRHNPSR